MSDAGVKNREEKVAQITLPVIDCACMDKRTRKIMVYLINKELKSLKTYPTIWVENSVINLEELKNRVETCNFPRVKGEKGEKGKRELSQFNLFIKECATSTEKGGKGKSFKECTNLWKKEKDKIA